MRANRAPGPSPFSTVLLYFRHTFAGVALASMVINVLALTGAIFMLQVYDRVLPARSMPTLATLAGMAAIFFIFQGILELIRSRLLIRIGIALDRRLSIGVLDIVTQLPLRTKTPGDGLQPLRDLDQIRSFLSGAGPTALFDLPWLPVYIGICFAFHFWIGMTALCGASVLVLLTVVAEVHSKGPMRKASEFASSRNALAEGARRNAEALQAMGFGSRVSERWSRINTAFQNANVRASDSIGTLGTISRIFRLMLQSGVLAVGAWLAVKGEATGGIMIASSIMTSRALAPIELVIANWKGFVSSRQAQHRLAQLFNALPANSMTVELPPPAASLTLENVSVVAPGDKRAIVHDASFSLQKGAGLGIVGPSASGKSSLLRAIAGVWIPPHGAVRVDGASLDQWSAKDIGRHIGYLPQDVQLFAGTIAENIARLEPEPSSERILAASKSSGVHDMIVHLPEGYDTQIGEAGSSLSAGQRQRIGLARALYGDPFLVLLDEPNSNLDADGELALAHAIYEVRSRGGIVIVVAHRPSALANLDQVLIMANGRIHAFGPKDEILNKMVRPAQVSPLKAVPTETSA